MKNGLNKQKTVCKKTDFFIFSDYIRQKRGKKPFVIAFWSRFRSRYYGKESSHVAVIKAKIMEVVKDALFPPRQSREQASDGAFSGW